MWGRGAEGRHLRRATVGLVSVSLSLDEDGSMLKKGSPGLLLTALILGAGKSTTTGMRSAHGTKKLGEGNRTRTGETNDKKEVHPPTFLSPSNIFHWLR